MSASLILPELVLFSATTLVSALLVVVLLVWRDRLGIYDVPNHRSSHDQQKPRTGGIAIFGAILLGFLLTPSLISGPIIPESQWILAGSIGFFILGAMDDVWHLPEWIRFTGQILLSAGLAFGMRLKILDLPFAGAISLPTPVSFFLTVFWLCGFINLFNFMDGIDGIAASEAAATSIFIYVFTKSPWALITAGASLGFLAFNFPPAKIFMGDGGSYLLGYLLATLAVRGSNPTRGTPIPFPVFVLLFGTFIMDTTVTLARRIIRGEQWFKAHRSHYYQRLTDIVGSHSQVTLLYLMITIALGFSGIWYTHLTSLKQMGLLLGWLFGFGIFYRWIHTQKEA